MVEPTAFENVYANMPRFGLGAVANDYPDLIAHVPAKGRYASARKRIEGDPVREKELA